MSRKINIDNYKSNNVKKLSNYSGLTVSEKINLFEFLSNTLYFIFVFFTN